MSTTTPGTDRTEIPTPPPRKPRKALKVGLGVMTVGLALGIGIGVGASGNHATMAPAAKPATTAPAAPATSAPAAPSTPAEQAPEQSTYDAPIGSTLTLTDDSDGSKWEVTVNSVAPFHQGEYDDPPGAGYHYIKANVTYHAIKGKVSANEWDWTAKDSSGQTYELASVSGGDTGLSATDIQAGQKLRGDIEFKVPDSKDCTLVYSSGMSEQASWTVPALTKTATATTHDRPTAQQAPPAPQAAAAAPSGMRYVSNGVYAGPNTSDAFALAVKSAWNGTAGVQNVYSPVTGLTYAMTYTLGANIITATGGNGAYVMFS